MKAIVDDGDGSTAGTENEKKEKLEKPERSNSDLTSGLLTFLQAAAA